MIELPHFLCIGIPARNEEGPVALAIESIMSSDVWRGAGQGMRELIVCMNGSTDGTASVIRGISRKHPEVKLIELGFAGKAAAINRIVSASDGRAGIIYFSDADVSMRADAIGKTVDALRANGNAEFAAANVVPESVLAEPKARGILGAYLAESAGIRNSEKGGWLRGAGFAVRREFIKNNPPAGTPPDERRPLHQQEIPWQDNHGRGCAGLLQDTVTPRLCKAEEEVLLFAQIP